MKKGLLGGTALMGVTAMMPGAAGAAETPIWQLSGNANFQAYWVDQDFKYFRKFTGLWSGLDASITQAWPHPTISGVSLTGGQEHGWYLGVDEVELQLDVSGTADNGLSYGFKIEINANTSDNVVADEARLKFSGPWGTLHMGDEDGAEDIMNYGGETLMGAAGGFDGDFDDVLLRFRAGISDIVLFGGAPSYPAIAGDTGDATKISYFSPRFSGFQAGASLTPRPGLNGDEFKQAGLLENHYGIGANYDKSFGDLRIRASAVYSGASAVMTGLEDIAAWSAGGIVGWGPFSLGGNYADNGDSMSLDLGPGSVSETSYWNVAAAFETGPMYFSAGYFESTREFPSGGIQDSTFTNMVLTADYSAASGLDFYAEIDLIEDDLRGDGVAPEFDNSAAIFIVGANVSF